MFLLWFTLVDRRPSVLPQNYDDNNYIVLVVLYKTEADTNIVVCCSQKTLKLKDYKYL